MKFAHMSDVHLGAWRDPRMKQLTLDAFEKAIDECLNEKVDFVLIAGDFLNTSLPGVDIVQFGIKQLMRLKDQGINTYVIPGSHDFSPSGKTMLNIMEEAGVIINVAKVEEASEKLKLKVTVDEKTGAKLTGILGRRGALEDSYYKDLDRVSLDKEDGFKIFMFHSALEEIKIEGLEKMAGIPISLLPKGFDYYAGGHVHVVSHNSIEGYKNVVYPGPLFPASFSELEELEGGGFWIYEDGNVSRKDIELKKVHKINVNAASKSAEEVSSLLRKEIKDFADGIVLIRVYGKLSEGRVSDVNFKEIIEEIYKQGAYFVMKNTIKLTTEDFEEIRVQMGTPEEIEARVINEHSGNVEVDFEEKEMTKKLMKALSSEQDETEKKGEYEERMKSEGVKVLDN